MRKYILSSFVALFVGFFLAKFFLEQYDSYEGIKFTSNTGETLYFIRYNTYSSEEEMEKKTLSLPNYIYQEDKGKYIVYVGITKDPKNLIKLTNYYSSLGYTTYTEEFLVTNQSFLKELENYDQILSSTEDDVVIASIASQVLEKYEEFHGSED